VTVRFKTELNNCQYGPVSSGKPNYRRINLMFTPSLQSEMPDSLLRRLFLVFTVLLIACMTAEAQDFNSGSNGSDGALNLTTPGTVIFDPAKFTPPLDPDGDNVFHFTTITIGPGVIVQLKNIPLRGRSVIWLASGDVKIEGTIDLSGQTGHPTNDPVPANRVPAEPGPGGYAGGVGATTISAAHSGKGPGRGGTNAPGFACRIFTPDMLGGGAGHATNGSGYSPGAAYGNVLLVPLRGGSGGGGGNGGFGGGGGGGGGALRIASSTSLTVTGIIAANGGDGGSGTTDVCANGNGGGGSGGGIHLIAPIINGSGSLSAKGGAGAEVYSGSVGRIRIDAFQHKFTGGATPTASLGTPYNVPLPADVPSIRVISVAGIPISSTPTGSFTMPDVTINQATAVPVVIEAVNVPVGVVVQVYVTSESAPDQVVNSTPLAGTKQKSTATANVKLPPGFSRGFVRAAWTP
jgi:hypothetical protein